MAFAVRTYQRNAERKRRSSKPQPVKVSVPYAPTRKGKEAEETARGPVSVPYAPTPTGRSAERSASRRASHRSTRRKTLALKLIRQDAAQRRRSAAAMPKAAASKRPEARSKATPDRRPAPKFSPASKQDLKPKTFKGLRTAGSPSLKELQVAASSGTLKTNKRGYLTTPAVREAAGRVKRLESKRQLVAHPLPGLTPQASHVARKVLARGAQLGATRKQKLAAAETGLVESGFENLPGGDADSEGWRQERSSLYPNPRNVKASATRFFQEAKASSGATAGELAANVQRPAEQYRGRYSERKPEAAAILRAYNKGSLTPAQSKRLRAAQAKAAKLGLKVGKQKVVTVPGKGRYVFPFPASKGWTWSRTDQGTDFGYGANVGAPIRALGSGVVIKTGAPGWPGEGGILLKLDKAKHLPSPYVFVYEGIEPTVSAGDRVKKGQLVGRGGITGSIEIGFADSAGVPLAHSIYTEGAETPQGKAMTNFLHAIERGKTRVPVKLLSVGGTLTPSGGGTVYSPSGAVEGVVPASGGSAVPRKGHRLSRAQKARRTFRRLKAAGVGVEEAKPAGEATSQTLAALQRKYGVGSVG